MIIISFNYEANMTLQCIYHTFNRLIGKQLISGLSKGFYSLECVSSGTIRKFEQILRQFKEETRRLSSAKSRVDDAEMAQRRPKLRIKEFLRHTLRQAMFGFAWTAYISLKYCAAT